MVSAKATLCVGFFKYTYSTGGANFFLLLHREELSGRRCIGTLHKALTKIATSPKIQDALFFIISTGPLTNIKFF
jgi:hypothetical protein